MVVAIEQYDVEDQVVQGTILIKILNAFFYSGCTHSFLTSRIFKKLGLEISTLSYELLITAVKDEPKYTILGINCLEFEI